MSHDRLARIAERQDGLITRRQALAAGMSPDAWKHATRKSGHWQRVLHGVYATFTGPLSEHHRLRAAILHGGPLARVTCAWACWMNGLTYGPTPSPECVVVLVPQESRRGSTGFVVVAKTDRPYELDHTWVTRAAAGDPGRSIAMAYAPPDPFAGDARPGVIPVVSAARAVIDTVTKTRWLPAEWRASCESAHGGPPCRRSRLHAGIALRNVRALMCEAVQRGTCTVKALVEELAGAPPNGSALARRVLVDLEAGCRSAPECELRDLISTSRLLPQPRWNLPLPGARGIYPDACWPEARLIVEVDSRAFHGFGDAPERTERRRARLAALGWTVVPVSPRRIREQPAQVLAEIEAAYIAGRERGRR